MANKSEQLQIRVTAAEKAALKRAARAAGSSVSTFVLRRALPRADSEFAQILDALREGDPRFGLAALNDLLTSLTRAEFERAVARADLRGLSSFKQNYVAGMVEQAAYRKGAPAPDWVRDVLPLEQPHYAAPLKSLRLHLLKESPVPFRRRNLFVDSGLGARV